MGMRIQNIDLDGLGKSGAKLPDRIYTVCFKKIHINF